jgi:uroporphyrinogen-III decarboxylase
MEGLNFPDPFANGRLASIEAMQKKYPDKFIIAGLGISGFNLVTFLRGFEDTLIDIYTDTERILCLTDKVMDFEGVMIRRFARIKTDAVGFADDWGTQNALMISPQLWRQYFKPRYKKQFDLVHELGMYVYFHSCGYILDILPDLIEIGVDIINLNQPDLFGVEELGERFAGKICFNCPVDHQTTVIHGTDEEIESYILRMKNNLSKNGGGYIGYIENYPSLGMTNRTYDFLEDAFYRNRKY